MGGSANFSFISVLFYWSLSYSVLDTKEFIMVYFITSPEKIFRAEIVILLSSTVSCTLRTRLLPNTEKILSVQESNIIFSTTPF